MPRIGYLDTNAGSGTEAFLQALRDLGYIDGKNMTLEYRDIAGKRDQIPYLVTELLELNVDVLVVSAQPAIRAAKQTTKTISIVMVTTQDPVAADSSTAWRGPAETLPG